MGVNFKIVTDDGYREDPVGCPYGTEERKGYDSWSINGNISQNC